MKRLAILGLLLVVACDDGSPPERARSTSASATAMPTASPKPAGPAARSAEEFRRLIETLSEPDAEFFSDNIVSNETSYLQVAGELAAEVAEGGVYLGVGPEQNFTYIALTRPGEAFVLDIRRANLVLHLLYKAAFDLAATRAEFLTLLLGRAYDPEPAVGRDASIEDVIGHAERREPTDESFRTSHTRLRARIETGYGITLGAQDRTVLERSHRAFFQDQLDLRFKLKEKSFRKYPSLREILAQVDPLGRASGFLATEDAFRFVQRLERDNRIVPVVGNFTGDHALPGIARVLRERGLVVNAFYVSNVEQYLLQDGSWWKWRRNVAALPTDARSLFLRTYLDQGRRHPAQMRGHRTTTLLQRIADFERRQDNKPYTSMWALCTEPLHAPGREQTDP